MDLTFTSDSQKTAKAFAVKTYKWTLTRVSDLYYNGSVVLPPRHSAYTTQRQ
jgi:hypothetical protein